MHRPQTFTVRFCPNVTFSWTRQRADYFDCICFWLVSISGIMSLHRLCFLAVTNVLFYQEMCDGEPRPDLQRLQIEVECAATTLWTSPQWQLIGGWRHLALRATSLLNVFHLHQWKPVVAHVMFTRNLMLCCTPKGHQAITLKKEEKMSIKKEKNCFNIIRYSGKTLLELLKQKTIVRSRGHWGISLF